uniref:Retrovirus-related Pol polyprotein from transposon TNT 1-94 n=1 Tax=Cajanus cajan TaxID=3821 RepID=A0A151UGM5_CAJCA
MRSLGTTFPISYYFNYDNFFLFYTNNFCQQLLKVVNPSRLRRQIRIPKWRATMKDEIDALEHNGTWTLEGLSPGKTTPSCKWNYKVKYKDNGLIKHFKGRPIVFDNQQIPEIDFTETFPPMAKVLSNQLCPCN